MILKWLQITYQVESKHSDMVFKIFDVVATSLPYIIISSSVIEMELTVLCKFKAYSIMA